MLCDTSRSLMMRPTQVIRGTAMLTFLAMIPLVTERPGRLRIVEKDGRLSKPLGGVPEVVARGQGGLLDVALDPKFEENRLVYLSYAEPGEGGAGTAVVRGRLGGGRLEDVKV